MGLGGAMVAGDLIQGAVDIGGQLLVNHLNQKHSASAYQRTVQDLLKAGLNPMLAYSQGPTANATMSSEGFTQAAEPLGNAASGSQGRTRQYWDQAAAESSAKLLDSQAASAGVVAENAAANAALDLDQKRATIAQTIASSDLTDAQKNQLLALTPGLVKLQGAQAAAATATGHSAEATAKRTESMQTEADAMQRAWKELDNLASGQGGTMAKMIQLLKILLSRKGE